jgi:hypothetical protein
MNQDSGRFLKIFRYVQFLKVFKDFSLSRFYSACSGTNRLAIHYANYMGA